MEHDQQNAQPDSATSTRPSTGTVLAWEFFGIGIVIAVGIVILGGLAIAITQKKAAIDEERESASARRVEPATPVVVSVTKPERVVDAIHLPGRIEAWTRVEVPCEVAGPVIRGENTPVEDGAMVKQGEALLHIDPDDYRINLEQAEAALSLAKETYGRTTRLLEKGVRTPQDLDRDRSTLQQAQAAYDMARLNLERCAVKSPITGQVDDLKPEIGEFVTAGTMIATVMELDRVKVEIGIPEKDVDAVRPLYENRDMVDLTVDAVKGEKRQALTVRGRCTYLSLEPAQQAYVYRMRLEVENKAGRLRPGMFAEARIVRDVRENSIVVPLFAVLTAGNDHFVYVADEKNSTEGETETAVEPDDRMYAIRRPVRLGVMLGPRVEILEGLKAGERLIIMGQRQVEEGSPVRITRTVDSVAELQR